MRKFWVGRFDFPMPFFLGHMIPAGKKADLTRYHVGVCDVSVLVRPLAERYPDVQVTISERPESVGSVARRFEYIATDVVRLLIPHVLYDNFPANKIRWFFVPAGAEDKACEVSLTWNRRQRRFSANKKTRFPVPKAKETLSVQGTSFQEALILRQVGGKAVV